MNLNHMLRKQTIHIQFSYIGPSKMNKSWQLSLPFDDASLVQSISHVFLSNPWEVVAIYEEIFQLFNF